MTELSKPGKVLALIIGITCVVFVFAILVSLAIRLLIWIWS